MKLYNIPAPSFVVQLIHVLSDETTDLTLTLPPRQGRVVAVREETRPARPAYGVPGPVALPRFLILHEDLVLNGSLG